MNLQLRVLFPGAGDWTDFSHLIRHGSKSVTRKLMNDSRKSVVDSFRIQLKHDNDLVNSFFAYDGRILAEITDEGGVPVFTGYIAPTFEQTTGQVVTALSLEILDNSYLLDELLAESFQYPATVGGTPYKILDTSDPDHSIIHQLLEMAGYPVPDIISASCPDITQTVLHIAGTKGDETYRELIDGLLFEYGYVFTFTEAGTFTVYHWDADTVTPTVTIQETDPEGDTYGTAEGLNRRKRDIEYDGAEVEWSKTATMEGALLYRENLPLSTSGGKVEFTGQAIAAGDYFPDDGDIEDAYQDFVTKWLDIPYLERKTRLQNKDISLITTSDHVVAFTADAGVAISSQSFESRRAKVLFQNTAGETRKLYTFEITGRALYRKAVKKRLAPSTSANPQRYTARHIYDSTAATRLTNALWGALRYGDFQYSWTMRNQDLPLGTVVTINLANPSMSTTAIVVSVERDFDRPLRQYTAIGISAYETYTSVVWGGQGVDAVAQQNFVESSLSVTPSFADLQDGYSEGGGTTNPTVPTLSAHGLFGAIHLSWDRQNNLTNFARYELQVSPDAGANWYPVDLDGAGYDSGSPGGDTDLVVERLIHTKIPHGGTEAEPTATTYAYRVRRVTKSEVASNWSSEIPATTLLIANGDLPANLILANKVEASFLNALVAEIQSYLEVSGDYGWLAGKYVSPGSGDQRAYLDKNELRLQYHNGTSWLDRIAVVAADATDAYTLTLSSCPLALLAPPAATPALALDRASSTASIVGADTAYGKSIVIDPGTSGGVGTLHLGYYTKPGYITVNYAGSHFECLGDDDIASAPVAVSKNAWGWKIGLYSSGYAIGACPYTLALAAPWLSTFYTAAWPAGDANNIYQPDSAARASMGVYGFRHGTRGNYQSFTATDQYSILADNLYYRSGWKRLTTTPEGCVLMMRRGASGGATGEAALAFRISTDSGTTQDGAATMETVAELYQASNATASLRDVSLKLGSAAGGSNRDVYLYFQTDRLALWDTSDDKLRFYTFECSFESGMRGLHRMYYTYTNTGATTQDNLYDAISPYCPDGKTLLLHGSGSVGSGVLHVLAWASRSGTTITLHCGNSAGGYTTLMCASGSSSTVFALGCCIAW